MPKVPTILTGGDVRANYDAGGSDASGSSALAASANGIAQGLDVVGRNLMDTAQRQQLIAAKLEEKQNHDNSLFAETQFTVAQRDWITWIDDVQKSGEENVLGRFNTEYADYQQKMLDDAPNDDARQKLQLKLDDLGTHVLDSSLKIQAVNQAKNTVNAFTEMVTTASDVVAKSPEMYASEQQRLSNMLDESVKGGRITQDTYLKAKADVNELAANAAEATLPTNPTRAKEIIDSAEGVPWTRRKSILNSIEQSQKSNDTFNRYSQEELLKSTSESVAQTGVPPPNFDVEQFVAAYPKNQQAEARVHATTEIANAGQVYVGRSEMAGQTPQQLNETLARYAPVAGDEKFADQSEIYKHLVKFADEQVKQFNQDPFSYSRQDPVVNKAWQMVQDLPDTATPQLRQQLTEQAMQASISYQKNAGIPDGKISVISNDVATNLAQEINRGDAKQVQETLGRMMQSYGKQYPVAFRSLVQLPEGKRIDASMQVVALHYGEPFIQEFVQAMKTPNDDIKIAKADARTVSDNLPTNANVMAFSASMVSANPGAVPMVADFQRSIEKYANFMIMRGTDPAQALKQSVDRVITSAYAFGTMNNTPIAIKRIQGSTTLQDSDVPKIMDSLVRQRQEIDPASIDSSHFQFPKELTTENRNKSIKYTLDGDTFWVTNPANDGAILFMHGLDGGVAPVKTKDGKQVEGKFLDALGRFNGNAQMMEMLRKSHPLMNESGILVM